MSKSSDVYDAVIIGAGIGGLVCGCYLAKAGMKVLIAEQHHKPGGYCTSFERKGYFFDGAAHSLGGYKHGILGKIFGELGIKKKIEFLHFDPSDRVITPEYTVSFWKNIEATIKEFQLAFPDERDNIRKFFHFFMKPNPQSLAGSRSWAFKDLLDRYFHDDRLKSVLSMPLFGNTGLPPSRLSAFLGIGIFKECVLDGGYYPRGGMQALSNALAELVLDNGGEIYLSCRAKKISIRNNRVAGVFLEEKGLVSSTYVISNCDTRQTYFQLLGKNVVSKDILSAVQGMFPSLSSFIMYLGVNPFPGLPVPGTNIWILSQYDLDDVYHSAQKGAVERIGGYLLHVTSDGRGMIASMFAPFKDINYWKNNKTKWESSFLKKLEGDIGQQLSNNISHKESATPQTLYRYTLNYKGAAYGWAGMPSQLALPDMKKLSTIQGLYLTGHWTTRGLGIPGVTYSGYNTARDVLRNAKFVYKIKATHG